MLWPVPEGHCFWRLNKIPVWGQTTFTDGHGLFPLWGTVSEASLAPADTCPSCWSQLSEGCTWVWKGRELPGQLNHAHSQQWWTIVPASRHLENTLQKSFPCAVVLGRYLFCCLTSPSRQVAARWYCTVVWVCISLMSVTRSIFSWLCADHLCITPKKWQLMSFARF